MPTTLKFYLPLTDHEDEDLHMKNAWDQGVMSYLMCTQRVSLRGNPCIKGLFMLNDDAAVPPELECVPLSDDYVPCLVSEFQEELSMENNGVELGSSD